MFLIDFQFVDVNALTEELTQAHRNHLSSAYEDGELLFGGPKVPRSGGIILSMHKEREKLEALLNADPMVKAQQARYEITEFKPVFASPAQKQVIALT